MSSFCNSSRIPNIAIKPFSTWGAWVCPDYSELSEPAVKFVLVILFFLGIQLVWHRCGIFSIVSFNPAWRMYLKSAPLFRVRSVALLTAIRISSTYWGHWSASTTGSKYSRMKLEKADTDLLRPCSSLSYARVLLAKLKASISTERWSAICKQW